MGSAFRVGMSAPLEFNESSFVLLKCVHMALGKISHLTSTGRGHSPSAMAQEGWVCLGQWSCIRCWDWSPSCSFSCGSKALSHPVLDYIVVSLVTPVLTCSEQRYAESSPALVTRAQDSAHI